MNKNMSESYKIAYGQVAAPSAGATTPAGKNRDEKDTLTAKHTVESVKDAVAVPGAGLKSMKKQAGENFDNKTQPNTGSESRYPVKN